MKKISFFTFSFPLMAAALCLTASLALEAVPFQESPSRYSSLEYSPSEYASSVYSASRTLPEASAQDLSGFGEEVCRLSGGPLVPPDEISGIPQARLQETSLLNLLHEVQIYYTGAQISAAPLLAEDTDLAGLEEGSVFESDLDRLYPSEDTLCVLEMSGEQLRQYMEWSAAYFNTYKNGDVTLSFSPDRDGSTYDLFAGIRYEINLSKKPGRRIESLTWPDGSEIRDSESVTVAVSSSRAFSQLLTAGEIFPEGSSLPRLAKENASSIRDLIQDYLVDVKGGSLEAPSLTGNWRLTGIGWDEALHQEAAELINSGQLSLTDSENGTGRNISSLTVWDLNRIR